MDEEIDRLIERLDAVAGEFGDFMAIEVVTEKGEPITGGAPQLARVKKSETGKGVVLQFGERMYLCETTKLRKALDEN